MASAKQQPLAKRARTGDGSDSAASNMAMRLPLAPQAKAQGLSKREAEAVLHKHDNTTTPYGDLITVLELTDEDGQTIKVHSLNPFAFLSHVASVSAVAFGFLAQWLANKECRLAFYCDGVTPGNVLRPDLGRHFEAIYWTFLELPSWFRSKVDLGWFPCCYIEPKYVNKVPGGMAAVAKMIVNEFFPEDPLRFNFQRTGVLIKHEGVSHMIRGIFGCWLADEKAIKEIVSCKGASGTKPCVCCLNVVNRTVPRAGDYLVHVSCPDQSLFVKQTVESLTHMATDLQAKKGVIGVGQFERLEQLYGLAYIPQAIIFDPYTRSVVRFPDTVFWDWMHCLVASGGVAQFQVNEFLLRLKADGISLKNVDDFADKVIVPPCWQKLTKTFFRDRTVEGSGHHLRAFASEMLTAIAILGIFVDAVVRPAGNHDHHVRCFDDLRSIVFALRTDDEVHTMMPELRRRLESHHVAFQVLYPQCVKPKVHYFKHCLDCIEKFKCNLSCFAPERKHKSAKQTANFSYNKIGQSMLTREIHTLLDLWQAPTSFVPCKLGRVLKMPEWLETLFHGAAQAPAEASATISTTKGTVNAGDLVWVGSSLCKMQLGIRVPAGGIDYFKVVLAPLKRLPTGEWSPEVDSPIVVDTDAVSGTLCHCIVNGKVFF